MDIERIILHFESFISTIEISNDEDFISKSLQHTNVIIKYSDLNDTTKQEIFDLLNNLKNKLSNEEFYIAFQNYAILEIENLIFELKEKCRIKIISNTEKEKPTKTDINDIDSKKLIIPNFYFMKKAIKVARQCKSEDDRIHPKVGAVVVKDGEILCSAFRGEINPGEHAEYTALEKKLKHDVLAGCTVYATLEPCIGERSKSKLSCCERLKDRKVSHVVIGMLDPNQSIRGNGIIALRKAGIEVSLFPSNLMAELEELNRDFIRDQESKNTFNIPTIIQNDIKKGENHLIITKLLDENNILKQQISKLQKT